MRKWCKDAKAWGSYIEVHCTHVINKLGSCELQWYEYLRATFFSHDTKVLGIQWNALIIASGWRQGEADGRLYLAQVLDSRTDSSAGAAGPSSNDLQFTLWDGFDFCDLCKYELGMDEFWWAMMDIACTLSLICRSCELSQFYLEFHRGWLFCDGPAFCS